MRPRVVVPDDCPQVLRISSAWAALHRLAEVTHYGSLPGSPSELTRRLQGADAALNIRASSPFGAEVFGACPTLRLVSVWGTGIDNIDLAAASRHGVTVTNTPGVNAAAVAEHTLALMLAVARRIPLSDSETKAGRWNQALLTQLRGKILGVIGLGAIGRAVARLAQGIGMEVIAWTMHPSEERARALGVRLVEKEQLLREADLVSLHLRLTPEATDFLGEKELSLMKPTAYLINTARGALVNRDALFAALRDRRIAGAGLDVFHREPISPDDPLLSLPNVVLTPHIAGMTSEVIEDGLNQAVANIEHFFAGQPRNVVGTS